MDTSHFDYSCKFSSFFFIISTSKEHRHSGRFLLMPMEGPDWVKQCHPFSVSNWTNWANTPADKWAWTCAEALFSKITHQLMWLCLVVMLCIPSLIIVTRDMRVDLLTNPLKKRERRKSQSYSTHCPNPMLQNKCQATDQAEGEPPTINLPEENHCCRES